MPENMLIVNNSKLFVYLSKPYIYFNKMLYKKSAEK